ncbi:Clavaminate synthase-like protein [Marasmius fiardii PR-910]|nr:Clavaminate synthase-like protein [Marasmius fiardii PR-910]
MSTSFMNTGHLHQVPERASVRLVAKTSVYEEQPLQWTTSPSSGDVRDPYPSEYNQPRQPPIDQETQTRKRGASHLDEEILDGETLSVKNVGKKSKKVSSTSGSSVNRPNNSSSTSSKRGFTAKKRNEAAQMAASASTSLPSVSYTVNSKGKNSTDQSTSSTSKRVAPLTIEVQSARCMSGKYKNNDFPRCVSCTRRWAGDTCRFQGVRIFMKDVKGVYVGIAFTNRQQEEATVMHFLDEWNEDFGWEEIRRTKLVAAKTLLPVLKREQEHTGVDDIIFRRRESEVRATCDTCMTSLFCCTWMCRICGREACDECYAEVKELTRQNSDLTPEERVEQKKAKEKQLHSKPFFLTCTRRNEHDWSTFTPVSRFCRKELEDAIEGMQKAIEEMESGQDDKTHNELEQEVVPTPYRYPPVPPPTSSPKSATKPVYPTNPITSIPDQIPSHPISRFTKRELSFPIFQEYWRKGVPLLVQGLLHDLQIKWTPEYFVEKYGSQGCLVVECQTEENKRVTVGDFFKMFRTSVSEGSDKGASESLGPGTWKLKDWPPSADFKTEFPELYADFSQAVPIPQYVRRDGVMNIASHFPTNTIAPDLGPKMYNAMTANEETGSKGSTRLHMDMADALNIMTYASPFSPPSVSAEGTSSPSFLGPVEPGCAAWDLFRAEDANKLRTFLKRKFPKQLTLDPIHSQQVYLDRDLRKELFDQEGVMSYRIYQRPGEAVFVPAGVAHQVCNLSDCIKVAIDFVSPENVERCEQLTREFREQNHSKAWKEDVLQLRSMMWFAWLSCCRQEDKLRKRQADAQTPHVSTEYQP